MPSSPALEPREPPPDQTETLRLALTRHKAQERAEAEQLYQEVLRIDPREPRALYFYGVFQAEDGRTEGAERLLSQLADSQPAHADSRLALGELAALRGDRDSAIARFRSVLALQPGHAQALLKLASLILERGFVDEADFDGAIDVCRAAIALLADPAPAQAVLGRLLLTAGRACEATEAYQAAVAAAPLNAQAQAGLALSLLDSGDHAAALGAAEAALRIDPDIADAWYAKGRALLAVRRPADAAVALKRGVDLAPDQARLHLSLGDAFAELDLDQAALGHLARAALLDPASKWAQANLGSMLYRCGDLEAAERHCRLALAADPDLGVAHQNLAGILAERGEMEEARRHRDHAFAAANVRIEAAPAAKATVLAVSTADSGNVPHKYLLPTDRYTRIDWFIEYAQDSQAAELPPYDLVFNIIGDPDYAEGTEAAVTPYLRGCEPPFLNDPAKVARTRRDRLPALLEGIEGVLAPKVLRFSAGAGDAAELATQMAAAGIDFPVLVRPMGSHGGRGLALARTADDLAGADAGGGVYVTQYVEYGSPADGRYRKYRAIFVDRQPYPYHLAIKDQWLAHYQTAEMVGAHERQAEELRFLLDPQAVLGERGMAALAAIGARLDLDFAGVDFGVLPDGRLLVFEANATMLVHPEPVGEFSYKNPFAERITAAFQALVDRRAAV